MLTVEIQKQLQEKIQRLGIPNLQRHIFLCAEQTQAKCCSHAVGVEAWNYLKKRLNELALEGHAGIYRTRANCLRVCLQGPIAVVYPDGIWYHSCTDVVLEKIIQNHLLQGNPVWDYVLHPSPAFELLQQPTIE